jgi:ABC-type nitrate/sulfonate/bicarbonate transport system ATPase subunit
MTAVIHRPQHGGKRVLAGETAGSTAVALDDATVAFPVPEGRVYTAVEKVRLRIEHGEFVAIVGPTGCGKSTLLNVAAGHAAPISDQGPIAITTASPRRGRHRPQHLLPSIHPHFGPSR